MRRSGRTRHGTRRPATLLVALATIALGCSGGVDVTASPDRDTEQGTEQGTEVEPNGSMELEGNTDTTLPDTFEPPARPEPSPDPQRPGMCDALTADGIAMVVSAQLDAFTRDEFDVAYGLTSPSFQRDVDRSAFEAMIRTDYAYLLDNPSYRLDECWARGRRGYILAGVRTAAREIVLRYDVSEEPGVGWRIDGATELPGIGLPDERVI